MNAWPEFEELLRLTGTNYHTHREALLKSTPNLDAKLQPASEIQPGQPHTMARILRGWRDHAALYTAVLTELDSVDLEWERKKVTGIAGIWEDFALRAHQEYKEQILPLCWESILKRADWPHWKLITFLRMMEVVPDEHSVEPLLAYIANAPEPSTRDVAAQALGRQPAAKVRAAIEAKLAKTPPPPTPVAEVLQRTLSRLDQ